MSEITTIASADIEGFPLTRRDAVYPQSRVMSEKNYTRIFRTLLPNADSQLCGGAIIGSVSDASSGTVTHWEVLIGGYYFKLPVDYISDLLSRTEPDWYIGFKIITLSSSEVPTSSPYLGFEELDCSDKTDSLFHGLYEQDTPLTDCSFYIQIVKDHQLNSSLLIQNSTKCFVVQDDAPTDTEKMWIDSDQQYVIKVYDGGNWVICGSVYK